jgi:hypothetical protein
LEQFGLGPSIHSKWVERRKERERERQSGHPPYEPLERKCEVIGHLW